MLLSFLLFIAFQQDLSSQQKGSSFEVATPESVGLDAEKIEKINETFSKAVENKELSGGNAIVYKDGKVCYYKDWGNRNIKKELPMTRDTIFRIYSMSKPITSVAVMQLVEKGKIKLDDEVGKYLPELADRKVLVQKRDENGKRTDEWEAVAAKRQITVRDLLRHTSGLTYGFFGNSEVDKQYRNKGVLMTDIDLSDTLKKLESIPLLMEPATRFHYSASTDVLGRLVEVASEQTFDKYLERNIFKPLKMNDTSFMVPKEKQNRFAEMYYVEKDKLLPCNKMQSIRFLMPENKFFSGGGGLCSSIEDYFKFAKMLLNKGELNGTRILKEETLAKMTKNQLEGLPGANRSFRFGLGFSIGKRGEYGWGGMAGTRFWVYPNDNMIVMFMVQLNPNRGGHGEKLKRIVESALKE